MGMEQTWGKKPDENPKKKPQEKKSREAPRDEKPKSNWLLDRIFGSQESEEEKRLKRSGYLIITRGGNGFVPTPEYGDIQIAKENMGDAFDGDYVHVTPNKKRPQKKEDLVWKIESVEKRKRKKFVGDAKVAVTSDGKKQVTLLPQGVAREHKPFVVTGKIPDDLENDDKIVVKFIRWNGSKDTPPLVRFEKKIGKANTLEAEREAVPYMYGIRKEFPPEVQKEAKEIATTQREIPDEEHRTDLTHIEMVTIDPPDAGDIDDGVGVEKREDGTTIVYVPIADVAHYVKPGSKIREEARLRGNSYYFQNEVMHMLPPELSKDLCSLNEGEEKRAFTAVITVDKDGKISSVRFTKATIKIDKKLSYRQADGILLKERRRLKRAEDPTYTDPIPPPDPYAETIYTAWEVTKKLKEQQLEHGKVDLGGEKEKEFKYNEAGEVTKISLKKNRLTASLIEVLALESNFGTADTLNEMYVGHKNYSILRTHTNPDPEKMIGLRSRLIEVNRKEPDKNLQEAIKTLPKNGLVTPKQTATILHLTEGHVEKENVRKIIRQGMKKAEYTTENKGHFSLGNRPYAQFTSPIRRSADIEVHDSLWRNIRGKIGGKKLTREEMNNYIRVAQSATERSRAAKKAEAEMENIEIIGFLSKPEERDRRRTVKIVDMFEGGLVLEEKATGIEGVLWKNRLGGNWSFDKENQEFVNDRTKEKYQLSDELRVSVHNTDLRGRRINWKLDDENIKKPNKEKKPENPSARQNKKEDVLPSPRRRVHALLQKCAPDKLKGKYQKEATILAGILNEISQMKNLSHWPKNFVYAKDDILFVARLNDKYFVRAKSKIRLPQTPELFLKTFERFLEYNSKKLDKK